MERRWLVDLGGGDEVAVSVDSVAGLPGERRVRVGALDALAAPLPEGGWLLRLADGRVRRLDVERKRSGVLGVTLDARPSEVRVRSERDAMLGVGRAQAGGSGRVTSSMPGKIVRLLVAPGDTVAEGAGLLILEAMKMENQVKAPVAGVVSRVHVAEGTSVEADVVLVEIEEAP
ncbi:MAG: hypothetical protein AMXMBFR64_07350 [Myxococcales bacterium]